MKFISVFKTETFFRERTHGVKIDIEKTHKCLAKAKDQVINVDSLILIVYER